MAQEIFTGVSVMSNPIIITLLYLTFGNNIEMTSFEIHMSCSSWFETNVKVLDKKKRLFSNRYYYLYDNKKVISYVCSGEEPT